MHNTTGRAEPSPSKPSFGIGTNSPNEATPAIKAVQHRITQAAMEQQSDEPKSVGESLRSLFDRFPSCASTTPELRRRILVERSNIPHRHDLRAQAIDASESPKEWRAVRDALHKRQGAGFIAALIGHRGTGKTQIAVQLMLASIAIGQEALYVKAMQVFLWIRATYKHEQRTELEAIADFIRPRLLVIDEIQVRGDTTFEDEMLTHIVDVRYDCGRDTLIVGNLDPEKVADSLGPSILDRLHECGGIIACNWPSFRAPAH